MEKIVGIILVVSLLVGSSYSGANDNLKAVVVTFRHGHRNLFHTYPKDPYKDEKYWEGGYGELTNEGKLIHYKVGSYFRKHYQGFLPSRYNRNFYRVTSTDKDRTMMSAACHMAGLVFPEGKELWNTNITWQPVPIHIRSLAEDPLMGHVTTCSKYERLYNELGKSYEFHRYWNQTMMDYIKKESGMTIEVYWNIYQLYDALYVETHMGYKLPDWTKPIFPEPLKSLTSRVFGMFCHTKDLARLNQGPMLNEIITFFRQVQNGSANHKYHIYSAHDLNVACQLDVFGLYEMIHPPYAACMILELREDPKTKKHFVNILFKNESDVDLDPHKMTMKGCEFDCDLDKFVEILKPVTIDVEQWKKECSGAACFRGDSGKATASYR